MTISFTQIVERDIPEIQFEINLRGGNALPGQQAYKDIFVAAERVTAGTSTPNEIRTTPFGSESEAVAWFGATSPGAIMCSQIYNYRGSDGKDSLSPKSRVWGIALAESAGVAATQTMIFANSATAAGTFKFRIGGHVFSVGVANGDDITTIGDKFVAAWEALPDYKKVPVSMANVGGTVTITASVKGAHMNTVALVTEQDPGVTTTATWGAAALAGGTLYPTLTTALANALATQTPLIVVPWGADNTTMELLVAHAEAKAAAGSELSCRVIYHVNDTVSNLATAADDLDDDDGQRICQVSTRGGEFWTGQAAAEFAAADSSESHLARSLNNVSLPNLYPPTASNRFTKAECDTLVKAGCTPLWVPAGDDTVRICRAVSIRTDFGVMDWALMGNLDYCRAAISSRLATKFVRMSIVSDTLLKTNALHVTTPGGVRGEVYMVLKQLEESANLMDVDTYWEQSNYELNGDLLSLQLPAEMVEQWHRTYGRLDVTV